MISRSLVRIASSTGATVLPGCIVRLPPFDEGNVVIDILPALPIPYGSEELGALSVIFGVATECLIRRYPSQWRLWNTLDTRLSQAEAARGG